MATVAKLAPALMAEEDGWRTGGEEERMLPGGLIRWSVVAIAACGRMDCKTGDTTRRSSDFTVSVPSVPPLPPPPLLLLLLLLFSPMLSSRDCVRAWVGRWIASCGADRRRSHRSQGDEDGNSPADPVSKQSLNESGASQCSSSSLM